MNQQNPEIIGKKILANRISENWSEEKKSLSKENIELVISKLLEEIKLALVNNEEIRFPGFFSFRNVMSKERMAMNLKKGEKIVVPAKLVPKARFSSDIKEKLSGKK